MLTPRRTTVWSHAVIVMTALVAAACASEGPPQSDAGPPQSELLQLPVAPGEAAISADIVPVSIEAPCLTPVMAGLGRYADVGWVTPRFFLVSQNGGRGYAFEQLPSGRSRFRASFRIARSEREAKTLGGERQPRTEEIAYCDIAGTLTSLSDTNVKRLASWPVPYVKVTIQINAKPYVMAVSEPTEWTSGGLLTVSVELPPEQARSLARDLQDSFGAEIVFIVSNRPLEAGCRQTIDIAGVSESMLAPFGLDDGEDGAVSLETLQRAVSKIPERARRVAVEGTCPEVPHNTANCTRSGTAVRCQIPGNLVDPHQSGVANVQTGTTIGG